jgi:hypothetical protein
LGALSRLHLRYGHEVAFLVVYIREAHPEDGWVLTDNRRVGIAVTDPRTTAERVGLAGACSAHLKLDIPVVVDDIGDGIARRYGGWPDRLCLVGRDGRIAYQGGQGPFGFRPDELEAAIDRELDLSGRQTPPIVRARARRSPSQSPGASR